jgi:hypothetical protein
MGLTLVSGIARAKKARAACAVRRVLKEAATTWPW